MSGDLLREAAALLRQRATDATPGPWWAMFRVPEVYAGSGSADDLLVAGDTRLVADADYIATMDPEVGLLLADMLIRAADADDQFRLPAGPNSLALAVARKILGRQP